MNRQDSTYRKASCKRMSRISYGLSYREKKSSKSGELLLNKSLPKFSTEIVIGRIAATHLNL